MEAMTLQHWVVFVMCVGAVAWMAYAWGFSHGTAYMAKLWESVINSDEPARNV